jgi:hypothetical protein
MHDVASYVERRSTTALRAGWRFQSRCRHRPQHLRQPLWTAAGAIEASRHLVTPVRRLATPHRVVPRRDSLSGVDVRMACAACAASTGPTRAGSRCMPTMCGCRRSFPRYRVWIFAPPTMSTSSSRSASARMRWPRSRASRRRIAPTRHAEHDFASARE